MGGDLADLTTACIHCGFCLEACPTFAITGNEVESPRGRIYLIRSALDGVLDWKADVRPHLDLCLGCLGCQTSCPSGVRYGEILELARHRMEGQSLARSALLAGTTRPGLLKAQLAASKLLPGARVPSLVSWAVSGRTAEAELPVPQILADVPPLDDSRLPPVAGEVYLLEGCAMRVLFPRVHQATRRLLRRVGFVVRDVPQGCCGAMHAHAGHLDEARSMREALAAAMRDDLPLVVDSAGCGSSLKDSAEFGRRAVDASVFLHRHGLARLLAASPGVARRATYHDACHLAHGQGVRSEPRELLDAVPGLRRIELPESDLCCGSAGTYNVTQPTMARALLDRKWANVERTGAELVVLGNPGCHAWIAQAAREHGGRVAVLQTMELLEASFVGLSPFGAG